MDEQNIRLMIPGPVEIHPKVYQAMNRLLYGHRTNEFREILKESLIAFSMAIGQTNFEKSLRNP
jgi:aspartate aminotransferase-like enzyme